MAAACQQNTPLTVSTDLQAAATSGILLKKRTRFNALPTRATQTRHHGADIVSKSRVAFKTLN